MLDLIELFADGGNTPACAGKKPFDGGVDLLKKKHPRVCGEE